jgi:uncharacterized protein YbaA (DUF1428 family)
VSVQGFQRRLQARRQFERIELHALAAPFLRTRLDVLAPDFPPGKLTSFPQAVQLKDGEVIALAWVVYQNKEDRDRISKAVMDDPQLKQSKDPSKMPFDGERMFWGGFETIIGRGAGR